MSPSLSVKRPAGRRAGGDRHRLTGADILFAALAHLLVIILIAVATWWQSVHQPQSLQRIEVRMISALELAEMQRHMPPRPKSASKKAPPKPAAKAAPAEEPFDPFAPLASTSDRSGESSTSSRDIADIMGKQLSAQELERYIAMMQQAVQDRWKVPASIQENLRDPLVEMRLRPDGSVESARIIESSGSATLDRTLIAAIYAAAPFQLPRNQFEAFRVNQIRFHPLR